LERKAEHIKRGNPRLRAALLELAWRLVRFQPHYRGVRKWKERLKRGALTTGAARKKAILRLARQLTIDLCASAPAGPVNCIRLFGPENL